MPSVPNGPRDLSASIGSEDLLRMRQHALDLAHSQPRMPGQGAETHAQRRQRITADASTWLDFILAGKIYGS